MLVFFAPITSTDNREKSLSHKIWYKSLVRDRGGMWNSSFVVVMIGC